MNWRASIFASMLFLLTTAVAQQPAPTTPATPSNDADTTLRIDVNLVELDAVVVDGKGQPVSNLAKDDFEALQDGKPQAITHFSYVAGGVAPGKSSGEVLRREDVRRTIAIVVDDLGLSFEGAARVRMAVKKFIAEKVQPGDLVAIVCTGRGSGVFQQFTSDPKMLARDADAIHFNPMNRVGLTAIPSSMIHLGDSSSNDSQNRSDEFDEFQQDYFTVGTLGSLQWVIRGLRDMPGRKSIVLFSESLAAFSGVNARMDELIQRVVDAANRSSVVFYVIDPRGMTVLAPTASSTSDPAIIGQLHDLWESQRGLSVLADATGGLLVRNDNDLNDALQRVMTDQAGYYLIGYKPSAETFAGTKKGPQFHRFQLRLKTTQRGLQIRTRAGFYGLTDEQVKSRTETPQQQLAGALLSPFGNTDVHVRLTPLFAHTTEDGSYVKTLLHVDARDLKFAEETPGVHTAKIDVVIATFDGDGQVVDLTSRTLSLSFNDADFKECKERGALFTLVHKVKRAGPYQFRAAVRDASSSRLGSAHQFIEIPDLSKHRIALSGIVLGVHQAEVPKAQGEIEIPGDGWPLRIFHRGTSLGYAYEVLNARRDHTTRGPAVEVQLRVMRAGQQIFLSNPQRLASSTTLDAAGYFVVQGAFRVGEKMEPGPYVLEVIVSDELAPKRHRTTRQSIDFEVAE